jgi:hypothetical protein
MAQQARPNIMYQTLEARDQLRSFSRFVVTMPPPGSFSQ